MKNYKALYCLTGLVLFLLFTSCEDELLAPDQQKESLTSQELFFRAIENSMVSKPFKAKFFTLGGIQPGPESEEKCGMEPIFYNVQEGYGEATHLGRFHIRITFCVNAADLLDDGVLSEGESLPYYSNENTEGYLIAANGDKLYISIEEGEIVPTNVEGYLFEFKDPFIFTGGTGRFEGATGTGITNSLVTFEPVERTDHKWNGVLELPRGS